MIAVDDHIEVNGINVRTMKKPGSIEDCKSRRRFRNDLVYMKEINRQY